MTEESFIPEKQFLACQKCDFKIELPSGEGIILTETDPSPNARKVKCGCESCNVKTGIYEEEYCGDCGYSNLICQFNGKWYKGSFTRNTMKITPTAVSCQCPRPTLELDNYTVIMYHGSEKATVQIRSSCGWWSENTMEFGLFE